MDGRKLCPCVNARAKQEQQMNQFARSRSNGTRVVGLEREISAVSTESEAPSRKRNSRSKINFDDDKLISPRRDVATVAAALFEQFGREGALKRAANELMLARRARSRLRFKFWQAIADAIETMN